ncbi:Sedlin [Talaromyces proteolyticus]|uniref:Sedlin n=1 Tax=Talaromyces proteolyticus TaxID=1131652 RepID=A0AAD4PX39_9EURO|nr:Sedlin [Talaromyces proteolyticus]KAH8693107.1 Sedlin [Talaromyces proteolyticus]
MALPSIACVAFVAKNDHPLHITVFPPFVESRLRFSFLINSSLDIFDLRTKDTFIDQDLGLLQAFDENLAVYGWLTNTGVKILIIVNLAGGRLPPEPERRKATRVTGINDSDLKPAFRALQTAYIKLLQNPFYSPDSLGSKPQDSASKASIGITDQKFISEVKRVGESWSPGLSSI